ncbi:MAG: hypothetical protein GY899_01020 [Verrucomicrobiaceae bacterium]|nr:hypothetical protein [Verrucomicrobiaceae bacterium]
MKIPSHIYGAMGGAAVASLAWLLFSPAGSETSGARQQVPAQSLHNPISAIGKTPSPLPSSHPAVVNEHSAQGLIAGDVPSANQASPLSATRQESRENRTAAMPPRDELIARAVIVEDQANSKLQVLTSQLGLSEEQQDRIFPILALSSPAFHPILQPEGSLNYLKDSVFGEGNGIEPGASVADVENEIYPVLDADQKASLEEKAIDREAWWEDIVALLEEDLDQPTVAVANTEPGKTKPKEEVQPADNQSAREAAATVNEIDDFSSLLRGN